MAHTKNLSPRALSISKKEQGHAQLIVQASCLSDFMYKVKL